MKKGVIKILALTILFSSVKTYAQPLQEEEVKVGFMINYGVINEPFILGQEGYGYEYLHEISKYTNHKYTYIPTSLSEGLKKLESGEIDLIGPLNKTKLREQKYEFTDNEFAKEEVVIITDEENEVYYNEIQKLDNEKIAIYKGSVHEESLQKHSIENNIDYEAVYIDDFETGEGLKNNEYEFALSSSMNYTTNTKVVDKICDSPLYFIAKKGNTKIIDELDKAIEQIEKEDSLFNEKMYLKYYNNDTNNAKSLITSDDVDIIRSQYVYNIGYNINHAPISYYDKDKEPQGLGIDIIKEIQSLSGININFIDINSKEAKNTDIDIYLGITNSEIDDYNLKIPSESYLEAPMVILGENSSKDKSNSNVMMMDYNSLDVNSISKHFKNASIQTTNDMNEVYNKLENKEVDAIIVSSYVAEIIITLLGEEDYYIKDMTIKLPLHFRYSKDLEVQKQNVFNKYINNVRDTLTQTSLIEQVSKFKVEQTLSQTIKEYKYYIIGIIGIVISIYLIILARINTKKKNEFKKLLETDPVTNVMTRYKFINEVEKILDKDKQNSIDYKYFILSIDIDNFKYINKSYGYENGNKVLQLFSKKLKQCYTDNAIIGRITADKFVVFIKRYSRHTNEKYLEHLSSGYNKILNTDHNLSLSQGVYVVRDREETLDYMLDCANTARVLGKNTYSSTTNIFTECMRKNQTMRNEIVDSMEDALQNNEFVLVYQPKYDLCTKKIRSAEALVRWISPQKGFYPDEFIPVFEGNGFIVNLDLYVFDKVCKLIDEQKDSDLKISVNLSGITLLSDLLIPTYQNIINKYNIDTNQIEIEITESAIVENFELISSQVEKLRQLGFSISMDDFGSGISSLNRLKDINVDVLKLDRVFINSNLGINKGSSIMESIIKMGKNLNLEIVAEGIETKEQLQILQQLGCDIGQGYYFNKPLDKNEFLKQYNINKNL